MFASKHRGHRLGINGWSRARSFLSLSALLGSACSDGSVQPGVPAAVEVVVGDAQVGIAGRALSAISLRVVDRGGEPLAGVQVEWTAVTGGGSMTPVTSSTDWRGVAASIWTLGPELGEQLASAAVSGLDPVSLRARATAGPPASLARLGGESQLGTVGQPLQDPLVVRVADEFGNPVAGAAVYWTATAGGGLLAPPVSTTDSLGQAATAWTLGMHAGENHWVRATVGSAPGVAGVDFAAAARPGPAASVHISPDSASTYVGQPVRFSATGWDAYGNEIVDRSPVWSVLSPPVAGIDSGGQVEPRAPGLTSVQAVVDGRVAAAPIRVLAVTAPTIAAITPEVLVPGELATIVGDGFSPVPASNTVEVAGVPVTVLSAATGSLTVRLPPASAFPCEPERLVDVSVTVPNLGRSRAHRLRVASPFGLGVGETALLLSPELARCSQIDATAGMYLVAVINTSTDPETQTPLVVHGKLAGGAATSLAGEIRQQPPPTPPPGPLPRPGATALGPGSGTTAIASQVAPGSNGSVPGLGNAGAPGRLDPSGVPGLSLQQGSGAPRPTAHAPRTLDPEFWERGRRLYAERGAPPRLPPEMRGSVAAFTAPPSVGSVLGVRFPAFDDICGTYSPIQARVAYSGQVAVILEDVGVPLPGMIDNRYQSLGAELDNRILPLIAQYFGDPLAMDSRLDANGRILVLFSRRVNDLGVGGFVNPADFYPAGTCPASNVGEIMYLPVPLGAGGIDDWHWQIQSALAHEAKHIASVAERVSRDAALLEEVWLEEATARIAEELWARTIFGYSQRGNTGYLQSLRCELLCPGRPLVMWNHWIGVYDYFSFVNLLTPLGPTFPGDGTFYGSAWLLVRWALDHAGIPEAAFLGALTRETARAGVANLEARAGRPFTELLALWALSLFTDDLPFMTHPELQHPSWDLYDQFSGMNFDFPSFFPTPFPLSGWALNYGSFFLSTAVRGGSAAFFALLGNTPQQQLIELQDFTAGPATLRLAIVRIQ